MGDGSGRALLKWRRARGMTQEQLAEVVGVSQGDVSDIENGRQDFSVERARAWEVKLGLPIGVLSGPRVEVATKTASLVGLATSFGPEIRDALVNLTPEEREAPLAGQAALIRAGWTPPKGNAT